MLPIACKQKGRGGCYLVTHPIRAGTSRSEDGIIYIYIYVYLYLYLNFRYLYFYIYVIIIIYIYIFIYIYMLGCNPFFTANFCDQCAHLPDAPTPHKAVEYRSSQIAKSIVQLGVISYCIYIYVCVIIYAYSIIVSTGVLYSSTCVYYNDINNRSKHRGSFAMSAEPSPVALSNCNDTPPI